MGTDRGWAGMQVIYVLKKQDDVPFKSIDPVDWAELQGMPDAKIARIIHAMDLTIDMKRQLHAAGDKL